MSKLEYQMDKLNYQITVKAVLQHTLSNAVMDIPDYCKPDYSLALRRFHNKNCPFPGSFDDRLGKVVEEIEKLFTDIENGVNI